MAETHFDDWIAPRYDQLWPEIFDPAVLNPTVDFLARLAGGGPALEFAVGTGRIALPLSRRGIKVCGIELSAAMVEELTRQGGEVEVITGDFATTQLKRTFTLVYLVANTITNLTTQDEQVAAFCNAAAHLGPGGSFVVENYIPQLQRLPLGQTKQVFIATTEHLGFEDYDVAAQIAYSHHYWVIDGELKKFSSPHRYLWPSELDLMGRIAGLELTERWANWDRSPFASDSHSHVSVWRKP
jgi:methyltransferase family protein